MVPQPENSEKVVVDASEESPPPELPKPGAEKQHHGHHGQDQGEHLALLPEEFQFLKSPECNPNLRDRKVRKIGCMRQANMIQNVSTSSSTRDLTGRSRRCTMFRQITGCIVLAWPVQAVMMLVILVDCTVAIMSLVSDALEDPSDEGRVFLRGLDIVVVCMLTIDVLGRFFFEGWIFLRSKLNLLELLLVPITIAEVWFLQELDAPVPLLRALRPILRGIRIFRILVRTAGKGANYLAYLRKQVSGERVRFVQDGFDLDLAYISAQIIAMSLPGAGYERLLHNPYTDVACFLNERHGNKYLLVNVTEERRYPLKPFFGRYYQYPVPYQGVPQLQELLKFCEHIDVFLKASPQHVVAIHSHHGQGRVSMMVIALLLYRGTCPSVTASIAHVEHNRTNPNSEQESTTQTLDNASQRRFMEYFGQLCRSQSNGNGEERKHEVRPVRLRRIALHGCSNQSRMDVKCFLPGSEAAEEGDTEVGASTPSSKLSMRDGEKADKENTKSLVDRVTTIINETSLDSVQAGCKPMRGRPVWSSADEGGGESMTLKRSNSQMSSFLDPARWETPGDSMRFSGEFRLEFHRRAAPQGKVIMRQSQQERVKHQGRRCLRCCCCKQRNARKSTQDKLAQVHSGMLFACWLHSDFLELDESQDNPSTKKYVVMVELDRFNLDKASNAPTMRSYSSVLKVQLEFEVERRIEWVAAEEEEELAEHMMPIQPTANMSESYTLEWLTWVSKRVWPSFTSGFESLLRNNLMPSLKESMPGPLKNIRLAQCSFGSAYPQFGPINACSRNVDGLEVQLDIQLNYSTATMKLHHNALGDATASGIARLLLGRDHALAEIHLSHNRIGRHGARELVAAAAGACTEVECAPVPRYPSLEVTSDGQCVPLWLRLEHNQVERSLGGATRLQAFAEELLELAARERRAKRWLPAAGAAPALICPAVNCSSRRCRLCGGGAGAVLDGPFLHAPNWLPGEGPPRWVPCDSSVASSQEAAPPSPLEAPGTPEPSEADSQQVEEGERIGDEARPASPCRGRSPAEAGGAASSVGGGAVKEEPPLWEPAPAGAVAAAVTAELRQPAEPAVSERKAPGVAAPAAAALPAVKTEPEEPSQGEAAATLLAVKAEPEALIPLPSPGGAARALGPGAGPPAGPTAPELRALARPLAAAAADPAPRAGAKRPRESEAPAGGSGVDSGTLSPARAEGPEAQESPACRGPSTRPGRSLGIRRSLALRRRRQAPTGPAPAAASPSPQRLPLAKAMPRRRSAPAERRAEELRAENEVLELKRDELLREIRGLQRQRAMERGELARERKARDRCIRERPGERRARARP